MICAYGFAMDYFIAIEMYKLLLYPTAWMNLIKIMLKEVRHKSSYEVQIGENLLIMIAN
jgi:hypothetical protein